MGRDVSVPELPDSGERQRKLQAGMATYSPEHQKMQRLLEARLKLRYPGADIAFEEDFIDVKLRTDDKLILYEVKSDLRPLSAIRQALGQLLEYAYHPRRTHDLEPSLVIVGRRPLVGEDRTSLSAYALSSATNQLRVRGALVAISNRGGVQRHPSASTTQSMNTRSRWLMCRFGGNIMHRHRRQLPVRQHRQQLAARHVRLGHVAGQRHRPTRQRSGQIGVSIIEADRIAALHFNAFIAALCNEHACAATARAEEANHVVIGPLQRARIGRQPETLHIAGAGVEADRQRRQRPRYQRRVGRVPPGSRSRRCRR